MEGPLPASLIPLLPRTGSAHFWVSSPSSSGYPPFFSPVAPCPASLPGFPVSAGSTAVPAGASNLYSRHVSAPCSVLTPSMPAVCLGGVSALPLSASVTRCGCGGSAVLGPPIVLSLPPPSLCAPIARVVGGFSSPPCPCQSSLGAPPRAVVAPGVLSPQGNSVTPGVSMPCGNLTPPPTPWWDPCVFLPLRRASLPLSSSPTPSDLWATPEASRPCRLPALPRFCRPYFPTSLLVSPFAPALPHGGPTLSPCWRPRRGLSWCHPRQPALPHVAILHRFPVCPMLLLSASPFPTPPPQHSSTPPPSLIPSVFPVLSTIHSSLSSSLSPWPSPLAR